MDFLNSNYDRKRKNNSKIYGLRLINNYEVDYNMRMKFFLT